MNNNKTAEDKQNYQIDGNKVKIINGFLKIKNTKYVQDNGIIAENLLIYLCKEFEFYINLNNQLVTYYYNSRGFATNSTDNFNEYRILDNNDKVITIPADVTIKQLFMDGEGTITIAQNAQLFNLGTLNYFNDWAMEEKKEK